jgi:hypothetical protein
LVKGKCLNYSPFLGKLIDREKVAFDSEDVSIHYTVEYQKIFFYSDFGFILKYELLNDLKHSKVKFDSSVNYLNYLENQSIETCQFVENTNHQYVCELAKQRVYPTTSGGDNSFTQKVNFLNQNCKVSKRPDICLECPDHHYLGNGECSLISNSTVDQVSYNPIQKNYQPTKCKKSYHLKFPVRKCFENIDKCSLMSSRGRCLKCNENYTLSQDQLHCFMCPLNCLDCLSPTFCSKCRKGYFLDSDKSKTIFTFISNVFQAWTSSSVHPVCSPVSNANQRSSALSANRIIPSRKRIITQGFASVSVTNLMSTLMEMFADPATNAPFAKSKDPTNVSLARSVPKSAPSRTP